MSNCFPKNLAQVRRRGGKFRCGSRSTGRKCSLYGATAGAGLKVETVPAFSTAESLVGCQYMGEVSQCTLVMGHTRASFHLVGTSEDEAGWLSRLLSTPVGMTCFSLRNRRLSDDEACHECGVSYPRCRAKSRRRNSSRRSYRMS